MFIYNAIYNTERRLLEYDNDCLRYLMTGTKMLEKSNLTYL